MINMCELFNFHKYRPHKYILTFTDTDVKAQTVTFQPAQASFPWIFDQKSNGLATTGTGVTWNSRNSHHHIRSRGVQEVTLLTNLQCLKYRDRHQQQEKTNTNLQIIPCHNYYPHSAIHLPHSYTIQYSYYPPSTNQLYYPITTFFQLPTIYHPPITTNLMLPSHNYYHPSTNLPYYHITTTLLLPSIYNPPIISNNYYPPATIHIEPSYTIP